MHKSMGASTGTQTLAGRQQGCSHAGVAPPQSRHTLHCARAFRTAQPAQRPQRSGRSIQPAPVTALFDFFKKKVPAADAASTLPTVVPQPSYNIPLVLGGASALSLVSGSVPAAAVTGILAAFLAFQASRVKFVFGSESLRVVIGEEEREFDNAFVGGPNEWKYSAFTNWEFWWPGFPVLVYFKETQTKPEGQIHFFPVIFNGREVYETMVERCGSSETSLPEGE